MALHGLQPGGAHAADDREMGNADEAEEPGEPDSSEDVLGGGVEHGFRSMMQPRWQKKRRAAQMPLVENSDPTRCWLLVDL